jgi:predicted Holliday junction resolvase-like endonuclease
METSSFIIVAIIGVLIFLAIRDLLLWYWKVNKRIELQEQLLGTMMRILEELRKNDKPMENKPQENKPKEKINQERIKD